MQSEFWHERWSSGRIGFHQERVNQLLQKGWSQLNTSGAGKVLVPLCGKSLDMLWLREQGHEVLGVELSELACQSFFAEQGVVVDAQQEGDFNVRRVDGVDIFCGDFFRLPDKYFQEVSWVYDRAALIAFPPEMRKRYAQLLKDKLPDGAVILLITLEFDDQQGPPFSVTQREVAELYGGVFDIEVLFREAGAGKAGRQEVEAVYALSKKISGQ